MASGEIIVELDLKNYEWAMDVAKDNKKLRSAIDYARDYFHLPKDVYDKFNSAYPRIDTDASED